MQEAQPIESLRVANKTIDKLRADLAKEGYLVRLGSEINNRLSVISSGSLSLDLAMGCGGYPAGKIVELYGPPSVGKSLLTLPAQAKVTQEGKYVAAYDGEGNHSHYELNQWRVHNGINLDRLIQIDPQPAEGVINALIEIIRTFSDQLGLIVIDSASALVSDSTLKKDAEERTIAETARYLNSLCQKLIVLNRHAPVLIINHVMANIGSMSPKPVAKGGNAIKHFASLRLEVSGKPIPTAESGAEGAAEHRMNVLVYKNKIDKPLRKASCVYDINTGRFDTLDELVEMGTEIGALKLSGAWYTIPGVEGFKVQGRPAMKKSLEEYPQIREWLFTCVTGKSMEQYGWT